MNSVGSDALGTLDQVIRVRALDSVFRLEVGDVGLAERIRVEWSRCVMDESDAAETAVQVELAGRGRDAVGYSLVSNLTLRAITAAAGRYLMIHAAGIADAHGRTAALIARSGTGKTTAAATLAAAGFGYVTDETLAVAEGGAVLAYPKPLSIVRPGGGKSQLGPDELGLGGCPPEPTLAALVLLDRVPEPTVPRLERLPLMDGLVEIIPQTSALPSLPKPLQYLARTVGRCGGVYRLTYHEISETAALISAALAAPHTSSSAWTAESLAGLPGARAGTRASALLDAIEIDGSVLILNGTVPVRLSEIGGVVWRSAREGADLDEIVRRAVQSHGDHPGASDLVRASIDSMREAGVLGDEPAGRG